MGASTTLGAFAVAVAALFGGAAALGAAVGPIDVGGEEHAAPTDEPSDDQPGGLAVEAGGFRLVADHATTTPGAESMYGFSVVDDGGVPVTEFEVAHERPLHLVVASRDLIRFVHVHPQMDSAGHWSVTLPPLEPGSYRVFADFVPADGDNLTLGTDLLVPGTVEDRAVPPASSHVEVDGYDVSFAGEPRIGTSTLEFSIRRDGQTVDTDPYLGSAAHLVVIRAGDLAYLHVHPLESGDGAIRFEVDLPAAGTHRMFLEFASAGAVHVAPFTIDVIAAADDTTGESHEEH